MLLSRLTRLNSDHLRRQYTLLDNKQERQIICSLCGSQGTCKMPFCHRRTSWRAVRSSARQSAFALDLALRIQIWRLVISCLLLPNCDLIRPLTNLSTTPRRIKQLMIGQFVVTLSSKALSGASSTSGGFSGVGNLALGYFARNTPGMVRSVILG